MTLVPDAKAIIAQRLLAQKNAGGRWDTKAQEIIDDLQAHGFVIVKQSSVDKER